MRTVCFIHSWCNFNICNVRITKFPNRSEETLKIINPAFNTIRYYEERNDLFPPPITYISIYWNRSKHLAILHDKRFLPRSSSISPVLLALSGPRLEEEYRCIHYSTPLSRIVDRPRRHRSSQQPIGRSLLQINDESNRWTRAQHCSLPHLFSLNWLTGKEIFNHRPY